MGYIKFIKCDIVKLVSHDLVKGKKVGRQNQWLITNAGKKLLMQSP